MTDTDAIKSDIEQHRAELAETVEALAGKLDVKARAGEKVAPVKPFVAPVAGVLAVLAVLLVVKKRRS